jgi:hypothetical protein
MKNLVKALGVDSVQAQFCSFISVLLSESELMEVPRKIKF